VTKHVCFAEHSPHVYYEDAEKYALIAREPRDVSGMLLRTTALRRGARGGSREGARLGVAGSGYQLFYCGVVGKLRMWGGAG